MHTTPDLSRDVTVTFDPAPLPAHFTWGVATSAYQIEGAWNADGKGPSIWDTFSHTPGKVRRGDAGDVACDHYHRWPGDLDLLHDLGVNAYRFSVSWPRVLPDGHGRVNAAGLAFYDRLVDGLLERGVTPWLTLYHWDLPQALQERGGWAARDTARHFEAYAEVLARTLGDRVKRWITHNEPWVTALVGYRYGSFAPGVRDAQAGMDAVHHVLLSHGLATRALRAHVPDAKVGVSLSLSPVHPASDADDDRAAAERFDAYYNRIFLDPLLRGAYPDGLFDRLGGIEPTILDGDLDLASTPLDFLGVNYYYRKVVRATPGEGELDLQEVRLPDTTFSNLDMEVYPDGLRELLVRLHEDYRPKSIVITENGLSLPDEPDDAGEVNDEDRARYIAAHLASAEAARRAGVPVDGYFVWSLLDNFEWAYGYEPRLGLVYVDYGSQRRTVKRSGRWYHDLVARHRAAHAGKVP
nr:GH1 family beta-glucosidase [Deinococcus pimensis]